MKTEEIEKIITEHFGEDHIVDINVISFGGIVDVELNYTDGPTLPDARRWMECNIPNIWHLNIDRIYSDNALRRFHLNEDDEANIKYTQNRLFSVTL